MAENLHPLDSAFVFGAVPDGAPLADAAPSVFGPDPLPGVLVAVSAIICLGLLRRIVEIIPYQIGALLRPKELVNLENSALVSRSRSIVALAMILPLLTVSAALRLYDPLYLSGLSGNAYFFASSAVIAGYFLLREGLFFLFPVKQLDGRIRAAAHKSAWTFLVTLTEAGFFLLGILSLLGASPLLIRKFIIVTFSALYIIYFVRKTQVLRQGCNFFQTFLYLCGLEILPTSLLIVSALVI